MTSAPFQGEVARSAVGGKYKVEKQLALIRPIQPSL